MRQRYETNQLGGSGGQRSISYEAADRFGDLAEASFSTPLARVTFLYLVEFLRPLWTVLSEINIMSPTY